MKKLFCIIGLGIFIVFCTSNQNKPESVSNVNVSTDNDMAIITQIPKEVQKIIDNYCKDSLGSWGFNQVKKTNCFDTTLHARDVQVGTPCEEFSLNIDKLENDNESMPIDSLILPLGKWYVPVCVRSKYIYHFEVINLNGAWHIYGLTVPGKGMDEWQKVRSAWPEKSGMDPILICLGNDKLLHFPQKGNFNLMYLYGVSDSSGTYVANTVSSYKTLGNSKNILKEIKNKIRKRKNRQPSKE